jgi:hypothetical protein
MKYGTSVCGDDWDLLMSRARERASILGQRVRVQGMHNTDRSKRILGSRYSYIILSPTAEGKRRCAKVGPNGKPCILVEWTHTVTHCSRGFDPDTLLFWHYLTKNNNPTAQQTDFIHSSIYTRDQLEKEGYTLNVD